MLTQKVLRQKNIFNSRLNYLFKKYTKEATASETEHHEKHCFAPHREKKPQAESFIFSLLTGKVTEEMISFPEVLTIDRYKDFHNWLNPIENYVLSCANANRKLNKQEVLHNLKELELFRAYMEEDHGLNLSETESLKLIETVSTLPWLGTYLVKNNILPVKILSKYGSISQKQEYYPKITNGEIVPTICIHEGDSGTNINNIKSHAIPIEGDSWLLNGKKTFVINGANANLFLVFARSTSKSSPKIQPDSFSLFLVEKDNKSVICSEVHETVGRHEIPTCTVSFKDVVIPNKNVIGEPGSAFNILIELLKAGTQNVSAQAITILRNFTNQLMADVLKAKHFDRDLYQFDLVRNIFGEIIFNVYTMESMAYFTSGLMDLYENQDTCLEKMITERYCANKCLKGIQAGIQLMGAYSYLNNTSYVQAFHDALALSTVDMNNMDADTYIGAAVLQQLGKIMHEHVFKKRNSHQFPLYNIFDSLLNKSKPNISVSKYFHPSFKNSLEHFNIGANLFMKTINALLIQNGSQVMEQYDILKAVTKMITELYAGITNLSRSSRSYCLGLRNTHTEREIGMAMAHIMVYNMHAFSEHFQQQDFDYAKTLYKITTELAYENHRYCMVHPIIRATM